MKYIRVAVLLLLLSSCTQKDTAEIPVPQMEKILQDIHIAEVYSSMLSDTAHRVAEKNMDSLQVFYNDVLKHHNVTVEQFRSSVEWYKDNPAELDTMYGRVINNLSAIDAGYPKPQ